jgi:hypothetical protein
VVAAATRPWGMIATFTAVGVVAAVIIGYAAVTTWRGSRPWTDRMADIAGVTNYRDQDPASLGRNHKTGALTYKVTPPVGGDHNPSWQNCTGDIYQAPIAKENAVHSLEHGAVWLTYRTGLPAEQVGKLAERVRGTDHTMLSPVDGLDPPISVQAWGYRLTVDSAADGRINDFIKAARVNAAPEPGAACSNGVTATGTTPRQLG